MIRVTPIQRRAILWLPADGSWSDNLRGVDRRTILGRHLTALESIRLDGDGIVARISTRLSIRFCLTEYGKKLQEELTV